MRGYLPLIQNDSATHMHCLAVYGKEGIPFAQGLSLGNSANFYLCFQLTLLHLLLSISFFIFMFSFDTVSSKMDEIFSITPSANVFVFGDFNIHHKSWLTYSSGTDRLG